jgi:hypothetical protein
MPTIALGSIFSDPAGFGRIYRVQVYFFHRIQWIWLILKPARFQSRNFQNPQDLMYPNSFFSHPAGSKS